MHIYIFVDTCLFCHNLLFILRMILACYKMAAAVVPSTRNSLLLTPKSISQVLI